MDGKASADAMVISQSSGNGERVRSVFENTPRYLKSRQVDIRFRVDTVRTYGSNLKCERGMDIGCGDGTISLQLVTPTSHFMLLQALRRQQ